METAGNWRERRRRARASRGYGVGEREESSVERCGQRWVWGDVAFGKFVSDYLIEY